VVVKSPTRTSSALTPITRTEVEREVNTPTTNNQHPKTPQQPTTNNQHPKTPQQPTTNTPKHPTTNNQQQQPKIFSIRDRTVDLAVNSRTL